MLMLADFDDEAMRLFHRMRDGNSCWDFNNHAAAIIDDG